MQFVASVPLHIAQSLGYFSLSTPGTQLPPKKFSTSSVMSQFAGLLEMRSIEKGGIMKLIPMQKKLFHYRQLGNANIVQAHLHT